MEAMLLGTGEPESWVMDWAPPAAAWELPLLPGEELGAELGSLEEIEATFTEPSPAVSSLGSGADECERADAALAAAEAQMGRGCTNESTEGVTATAETQLDEEDWEWLAALEAAKAPLRPRPAEAVDQPPGKKGALKPTHGPPPVGGAQGSPAAGTGKGVVTPKAGGPATRGAPARRKPRRPGGPRGLEEDEVQVLKVQKGGLTLPPRVKERQYDQETKGGMQSLCWQERGGWSSRS